MPLTELWSKVKNISLTESKPSRKTKVLQTKMTKAMMHWGPKKNS